MRKERNEKQTAANEVASVRETSVAATQYVERKDAEREQTLVSEINLITEQTKQALLTGTIEIGKRLTEAKCLVRHGEWGNWLAERVNYSQRSANNFMKIYKEYGATGLAAKSQSIANLSVTQAVAMFDLPAEERERFAEQNEADKMSIRQLKAEVAKAKDEEIAGSKKRLEEALTQSTKELSATKKSLDTEKSKNAEMATLGKATYAMDQMLKSYEELMDIVASVGNFDKVAANKMMIEISKSMATVEKKCKKKLTA